MLKIESETISGKRLAMGVFVAIVSLLSLISLVLSASSLTQAANHSTQSDLQIKVSQVLSFSLQNCDSSNSSTLNIDIIPTTSGSFKSNCQTANIHTNAPGYSLTAKASTTTLNYLNPTTINPTPTISPTTNTTTSPNTLTNNTWGFAAQDRLNFDTSYTPDNPNNKYAQLPTTDTPIYQTDQYPLPQTQHKLYYATKLTPETMAGTYAATVTYTAIGSVVEDPPAPMQNWAGCSAIPTPLYTTTDWSPYTVVLTDIRNNQDYRVRKLPDGKCWMIDNLKLATPGTELTLTSGDTNLAQGETFTIPAQQATATTNTAPTWNDPSNTEACPNNTAANDIKVYNPSSLTKCGYLYNWYTATAGTGTAEMTTGNAAASICPVGWRLPNAGVGTATTTNEFAVLNGAMIGTGPSIYYGGTHPLNWRPTGPFEGVYAGYWSGSFSGQGYFGLYWSSSARYADNRTLGIDYNTVYPGSQSHTKSDGSSVRCVL